MGKHFKSKHPTKHNIDAPFKFKILETCKGYVDRQIWQSVHIKRLCPSLNVQLAAPDEWNK